MRVLIVHPCKGFYGGAEEVVAQLYRYLINHDVHCKVVLKDAPNELVSKLFYNGILSSVGSVNSYLSMWKLVKEYLNWADVVNVHNFPATLMPFPSKRPTVYVCNEPAEYFTNWWRKPIEVFNRWWVRKSGMKVVVADGVNAGRFRRLYKVEAAIIPYGIDYNFWSQVDSKREDKLTILQVGHPEFFRVGQEVLEEIRRDIPEARLVQLMGKSHEEVRRWYGRAHVLIHPVKSQGGWLVPFEAMCAGLPVVVSNEFTASDLIRKNKLGVATLDISEVVVQGLYKGIDTKISKEWVKENLTWEKFGESMVKVFEEATSESRR